MRSFSKIALLALAASVMVHWAATVSIAQESAPYPNRIIRVVVPFGPGSTTDIFARIVSQKLSLRLKQSVVVENKPGAGGNIGIEAVTRAPADGYTLLMGAASTIINPSLYKNLRFDPMRDLVPITNVASVTNVLVVSPQLPVHNVRDLIGLARNKQLSFASGGVGGTIHLSGELFKHLAGIDMVHVPYNGSAAALPDLLVGRTDMMFDSLPTSLPHIREGKLRPLAVTAAKRSPLLPEVPTMAEAGLAAYQAEGWYALFAPAATPASIVEKLNREISLILSDKDLQDQFRVQGAEAVGDDLEHFRQFVKAEHDKWARVISAAKITSE